MKSFILIAAITLLGFSILLVSDYIYVNAQGDTSGIKYLAWLNISGILVTITLYYWVCFSAIKHKTLVPRTVISTFATIILAFFWFIAAFSIVGNFHLAIGGKL